MNQGLIARAAAAETVEQQVLQALRQIIRLIDIHSRSLVKDYGLTGPQLVVLQEVSRHDEISPGRLAGAVSLSQATVTGILERLEKQGLIDRRRSESDRRSVLVRATPEAVHMLDTGPPVLQTAFVEAFQDLEDWEQTGILSALQRLVSLMSVERQNDPSPQDDGLAVPGGESPPSGRPEDAAMKAKDGKNCR
jgi:DNA-binding MarR family transcriptional regulator